MAALRLVALAAALVVASPATGETVADWRPLIAEASQRFGLPTAWIERVMQAESAGRTTSGHRPIVSAAGAMGLMQVMPATWAEMRLACRLGNDPFDPHDNIIAGTAYLRRMYDRFGYPGMFAAYNAGPGRYDDFLAGRRRLPGETRAYLSSVLAGDGGARRRPSSPFTQRGNSVFVPLAPVAAAPHGSQDTPSLPSSLFIPLQRH